MARAALVSLAVLLFAFPAVSVDLTYQTPPKPVAEALRALPTPLVSISPQHDAALFLQAVRYPSINEVAQPMARLAGIRIDTDTNNRHLARSFTSFALKRLDSGADIALQLPPNGHFGAPVWSPNGKHFAFTNTTANHMELWVASAETGAAQCIPNVTVNGVVLSEGFLPDEPVTWLNDNRTLLVRTIPAHRGPAPAAPRIPAGPHAQESLGHAGPAPTYEDLLATPHDEDLFDYYATAQLAFVDTSTRQVSQLGQPGVFVSVKPSPDNQAFLLGRLHRPYSYQLPANDFPQDLLVLNRQGSTIYKLASLPLADRVPLAGVRTGPRSVEWLPNQPAALTWVEALDGGNPKETVPHRDRLMTLAAPFGGEPTQLYQTKDRFRDLQALNNGKALVEDYERLKRTLRTTEINLNAPGSEGKVLFTRNERDAYHDPGKVIPRIEPDGRRTVLQSGDNLYLTGLGASPTGEHPFLDRFNLQTGQTEHVFQASGPGYEAIVAVLDDSGKRLLTRRESPTDPPNYFLRQGGELQQLTHYANPMPQAAGVRKQLVTYKRADGVPLSFTLYLPAGYQDGTKLPTVVWAYPYEFSDAATAGQVTGHEAQSFPELTYHQLVVLDGYALLDNAAMPIVGDADTVNNTYVEQLKMDAEAAIDKAVEMGVADRDRIGVFGHSYGAFMTANLLAHTSLFHAGVAESGAYNRTLTPFGFQTERRSFWEAPDVYTKMSPFWFAQQIKTPILLIHGEADDNTGTFPIQSERLYAAIRGNGGTVRLVMLPAEAHGYRAIETMDHVLFEELNWFNKYLK